MRVKKPLNSMSTDLQSISENLERIAVSLERMVGMLDGIGRAGRVAIEPFAMIGRMIEGNRSY